VDAPLRLAGRARGESDQRDIVLARVGGDEARRDARQPRLERAGAGIAVIDERRRHAVGQGREILHAARVDDRVARLGPVEDGRDLAGAQHRHRRDDDAARLQHREPGGEEEGGVRPAQQHAVAGDQPLFLDQQPRQPVRQVLELGIGPGARVVADRDAGAIALRHRRVEQRDGRVQAIRIMEFGPVEAELRQLFGRRQALVDEAVAEHWIEHGHLLRPLYPPEARRLRPFRRNEKGAGRESIR
jgi:hypothetical protein